MCLVQNLDRQIFKPRSKYAETTMLRITPYSVNLIFAVISFLSSYYFPLSSQLYLPYHIQKKKTINYSYEKFFFAQPLTKSGNSTTEDLQSILDALSLKKRREIYIPVIGCSTKERKIREFGGFFTFSYCSSTDTVFHEQNLYTFCDYTKQAISPMRIITIYAPLLTDRLYA